MVITRGHRGWPYVKLYLYGSIGDSGEQNPTYDPLAKILPYDRRIPGIAPNKKIHVIRENTTDRGSVIFLDGSCQNLYRRYSELPTIRINAPTAPLARIAINVPTIDYNGKLLLGKNTTSLPCDVSGNISAQKTYFRHTIRTINAKSSTRPAVFPDMVPPDIST